MSHVHRDRPTCLVRHDGMRLFVLAVLLVACNAAPPTSKPEEAPPRPSAPSSIDAGSPAIPVSIDATVVTAADAALVDEAVAYRCEPYFSKCSCSDVCGTRPQRDCANACEPTAPSELRCAIVDGTCQAVEAKRLKPIE